MNTLDQFHHDLGEIRRRVMDGVIKPHETVTFNAGTLSAVWCELTEMIHVRELSEKAVSDTIKKLEILHSEMKPVKLAVARAKTVTETTEPEPTIEE